MATHGGEAVDGPSPPQLSHALPPPALSVDESDFASPTSSPDAEAEPVSDGRPTPAQHHASTLRSAAAQLLQSVRSAGRSVAELASAMAHGLQADDDLASDETASSSDSESESDAERAQSERESDDGTEDSIDDDDEEAAEAPPADADLSESERAAAAAAHAGDSHGLDETAMLRKQTAYRASMLASSATGRASTGRTRLPSYRHRFERESCQSDSSHPMDSHGLIGNCRTSALVSTHGSVVWYCYPNHDSPSLFHSLLDARQGGFFSISAGREVGPGSTPVTTRQLYHTETNVLLTRFFSDSGVGHVTDYMCVGEGAAKMGATRWLVRELEVVRGKMYFRVECSPRFNYGRTPHQTRILPCGALFVTPDLSMLVSSSRNRTWKPTENGGARTKVRLNEGQRVVFVFREWSEAEEKAKWEEARHQAQLIERQKSFLERTLRKIDLQDVAATSGSPTAQQFQAQRDAKGESPNVPAPSWVASPKTVIPTRLALPQPSLGADGGSGIIAGPVPVSPIPAGSDQSKQAAWGGERQWGRSSKDRWGLHQIKPVSIRTTDRLRKHTMEYWRDWVNKGAYEGRWREMMRRSALLLKLLTYEPTGAIIQSPTCSLPSVLGVPGPDARFVNLRDAGLAASAFLKLGFRSEASAFMCWLARICDEHTEQKSELSLFYTIHGTTPPAAAPLPNVSGYRDSGAVIGVRRPKRVCLDMYGTLLVAIYLSNMHAEPISYEFWRHTRCFVNYVASNWKEADEGRWDCDRDRDMVLAGMKDHAPAPQQSKDDRIAPPQSPSRSAATARSVPSKVAAEFIGSSASSSSPPPCSDGKAADAGCRPGMDQYTLSKLLAWVCMDRGIRLAHERSFPAPIDQWKVVRDQIYTEIQNRSFNCKLKSFTQTYDGSVLDASMLLMPTTGFCAPTDPRFLSTLDAILRPVAGDGLCSNSLIHRTSQLQRLHDGTEAVSRFTTSICTFWAIEACTRAGLADQRYIDRARLLMEQMLSFANPVGLYSECIGLRGDFLGNMPHGPTHVALVRAAMYLDLALDRQKPHVIVQAMSEDGIPSKAVK